MRPYSEERESRGAALRALEERVAAAAVQAKTAVEAADANLRRALTAETAAREAQGVELLERQGLTLLHISAQRKRFEWDRGCI